MSYRTFVVSVFIVVFGSLLAARAASAQEAVRFPISAQDLRFVALSTADVPTVAGVTDTETAPASPAQVSLPTRLDPSTRTRSDSRLVLGLYASTVALQALDTHSTLSGLRKGAVESNGVMGGITKNRVAFIAVKAAMATGTIFAARHIAKRNKVAAIAMLVAVNSAYVFVAVHNYKVASRLR